MLAGSVEAYTSHVRSIKTVFGSGQSWAWMPVTLRSGPKAAQHAVEKALEIAVIGGSALLSVVLPICKHCFHRQCFRRCHDFRNAGAGMNNFLHRSHPSCRSQWLLKNRSSVYCGRRRDRLCKYALSPLQHYTHEEQIWAYKKAQSMIELAKEAVKVGVLYFVNQYEFLSPGVCQSSTVAHC